MYRPGLLGHIGEGNRPIASMLSVTVLRSGGPPPVSPTFTSAATAYYLNFLSKEGVLARVGVPDLHDKRIQSGSLDTRRGQAPAVGAERQSTDRRHRVDMLFALGKEGASIKPK